MLGRQIMRVQRLPPHCRYLQAWDVAPNARLLLFRSQYRSKVLIEKILHLLNRGRLRQEIFLIISSFSTFSTSKLYKGCHQFQHRMLWPQAAVICKCGSARLPSPLYGTYWGSHPGGIPSISSVSHFPEAQSRLRSHFAERLEVDATIATARNKVHCR